MPKCCSVLGCNTGKKSDIVERKKSGIKRACLFHPPQNPVLFERWKATIPHTRKEFGPNNLVCALHFIEDDVIRYFKEKMPDGKIWMAERGRPCLREGAVPCIFPKVPTEMATQKKKTKTTSSQNIIENIAIIEPYVFNTLKKDISSLNKPPWTVTQAENFIAILNWTAEFSIERWIVISDTMIVKVFLKDIETTMWNNVFFTCYEDVLNFIKKIGDLVLCSGSKYLNPKCRGFLHGDYEVEILPKCKSCSQEKKAKQQPSEDPGSLLLASCYLRIKTEPKAE